DYLGHLLGGQYLNLVVLNRRRTFDARNVARQDLVLNRYLQGAVKYAMGMSDGARRQWSAVLGTRLQQCCVPALHLLWLEHLEFRVAKVWNDLVLRELPVAFPGFWRKLLVADVVKPLA